VNTCGRRGHPTFKGGEKPVQYLWGYLDAIRKKSLSFPISAGVNNDDKTKQKQIIHNHAEKKESAGALISGLSSLNTPPTF